MARYGSFRTAAAYNRYLMSFHFFASEAEALAYVKARRWRKYVLSSNEKGDCWTLYHNGR